ncbi:selenocysteine-specific translation elongation factor [Desulfococcus sp.]|uniref:selenocysteine-specific translation elongation factor n=1 Tax=Desulfococcus sp. TaxID=2025834 RepID=UPI003D128220
MSHQIILGTAGHIDHGKTTLIKALTGINTDRLKEEQRRGITIELGFAAFDLPGGRHVGIVDVPGHEKFVKNMVAGATGIDIVAMVIAADEGVMPQTREHMEICALLGVRHGLVVLTKVDLVDEEWLELVMEDIRDFVQGTFLEDRPIVPVSSVTGRGMDDFVAALEQLSREVPERSSSGIFRLPVDRVFTMRGFGTVITGTLISGRVSVGETVMLYPSGITAKVRGIQVHNQAAEAAEAGMRTAVNFQGLEKTVVNRGDILSTPAALAASYMVDVMFHYLKSNRKPIKNRTRVRFHTGTSEVLGNLILLDTEELVPGESAPAQLRLETPVALVKDDRFVARSYSPVRTVGGGKVLNPIPVKHKRFDDGVVGMLRDLDQHESGDVICRLTAAAGYPGVSFANLKVMTNIPEKPLRQKVQGFLSDRTLVQVDSDNQIFIHQENLEKLKAEISGHVFRYHEKYPLKPGMPKEELKSRFPSFLGPKLFNLVLNHLIREKILIQEEDMVRLSTHKVALKADQEEIRKRILEAYVEGGLTPPYFKDLCRSADMDPNRAKDVLMILISEGLITKIREDLYVHTETLEALKAKTKAFLKANTEMTTLQFKEIAGVSRKFLIPFIEYFDAQNLTIRIGDIRKLRGG